MMLVLLNHSFQASPGEAGKKTGGEGREGRGREQKGGKQRARKGSKEQREMKTPMSGNVAN